MEINNSLETLNIITFLKILQDNNYKRLDSTFNESKQYSETQIKELENTWYNLYDEYFELKNDHVAKSYMKNQKKLITLEFTMLSIAKIHDVLANLSQLKESNETLEVKQNAIANIKEIDSRIKINIFDTIPEICEKLQKVVTSLSNELGTIKNNQEKRVEKKKTNVYKVVANVEQILERSLGDVSKISVTQFLAYEEMANDKIKSNENKKK